MRFAVALLAVVLLRAVPAAADLYRWVDPESGSVKFSSYPPPWYEDPTQARRAPKVEHIPAGRDAAAKTDEAAAKSNESARRMEILETQRKATLQELAKVAAQSGGARGSLAVQKYLEAYATVLAQMDRVDPEGAAARRGELQMLSEKVLKGELR
jgi:hypothetical protein